LAAYRGPLVTLTAAVALLTACTGDPEPPPPPTTQTATPPSAVPTTTLPAAPAVKNPLNTAVFEAEPCRSLTETQQKQFGLDRGKLTDAAVEGNSCFYRYPDPKTDAVSVTYASKSTNGLSTRYIERSRSIWSFWEPAEIDGYPGVAYDTTDDKNDPGFCHFAVGLTDSLFFWVTAVDKAGAARCSTAKAVATAVVATVRTDQ
jgi:hypothetical protein